MKAQDMAAEKSQPNKPARQRRLARWARRKTGSEDVGRATRAVRTGLLARIKEAHALHEPETMVHAMQRAHVTSDQMPRIHRQIRAVFMITAGFVLLSLGITTGMLMTGSGYLGPVPVSVIMALAVSAFALARAFDASFRAWQIEYGQLGSVHEYLHSGFIVPTFNWHMPPEDAPVVQAGLQRWQLWTTGAAITCLVALMLRATQTQAYLADYALWIGLSLCGLYPVRELLRTRAGTTSRVFIRIDAAMKIYAAAGAGVLLATYITDAVMFVASLKTTLVIYAVVCMGSLASTTLASYRLWQVKDVHGHAGAGKSVGESVGESVGKPVGQSADKPPEDVSKTKSGH